jgi:LmbE family N-acetylglucosaminyl deacetylase
MRRLIVAPHADDETFGCGGLLAKYPRECSVLVLGKMPDYRLQEFLAAAMALGYEEWETVSLPPNHFADDMQAMVDAIDKQCYLDEPDELYIPYPSMHQDHVAAYEAGMRAARLSMNEDHWYPPSVLVYDVPAYDLQLYPTDLRWNVFEELTEAEVQAKVAAMACYKSQQPAGAHPVNGVRDQAAAIGHPRRVAYAEQYALVRQVRG